MKDHNDVADKIIALVKAAGADTDEVHEEIFDMLEEAYVNGSEMASIIAIKQLRDNLISENFKVSIEEAKENG